ncbi:MAG: C45 family autoproteolytic acyltransferase/hydrolase [Waddliaceae bacterium]
MSAITNSYSQRFPLDGSARGPSKPKYKNVVAEKISRYAFDHPKVAKTSIVALSILLSPIVVPALAIASIGAWVIGVRNGYTPSDSVRKVGRLFTVVFDLLVPAKCNPKQRLFTQGQGPKGLATVSYEGDLPVLTLKKEEGGDYHYNVGYDQGYLLADPIQKMLHKWLDSLLWVAIPDPEKVPHLIEQLQKQIPQEYLDEMKGIAEGFNQKMKDKKSSHRVKWEQVLLLQLVPDILHSRAWDLEKRLKKEAVTIGSKIPLPAPGCTTILDHDENGHVVFGRNMDWPSLGVAGPCTIMKRRECGGKKILEIGTLGLVGTITGISSELSLAMNVAEGETQNVKGLPASIFNRMCIENCSSIDEVSHFIQNNPTLGPYHLTVATEKEGRVFDLYQGKGNKHYQRSLDQSGRPLVTTNCRYNEDGANTHHSYSKQREHNIAQFYQANRTHMTGPERVQQALALPVVNNNKTVHHAILYPAQRRMSLAINNSYAARDQRQDIAV